MSTTVSNTTMNQTLVNGVTQYSNVTPPASTVINAPQSVTSQSISTVQPSNIPLISSEALSVINKLKALSLQNQYTFVGEFTDAKIGRHDAYFQDSKTGSIYEYELRSDRSFSVSDFQIVDLTANQLCDVLKQSQPYTQIIFANGQQPRTANLYIKPGDNYISLPSDVVLAQNIINHFSATDHFWVSDTLQLPIRAITPGSTGLLISSQPAYKVVIPLLNDQATQVVPSQSSQLLGVQSQYDHVEDFLNKVTFKTSEKTGVPQTSLKVQGIWSYENGQWVSAVSLRPGKAYLFQFVDAASTQVTTKASENPVQVIRSQNGSIVVTNIIQTASNTAQATQAELDALNNQLLRDIPNKSSYAANQSYQTLVKAVMGVVSSKNMQLTNFPTIGLINYYYNLYYDPLSQNPFDPTHNKYGVEDAVLLAYMVHHNNDYNLLYSLALSASERTLDYKQQSMLLLDRVDKSLLWTIAGKPDYQGVASRLEQTGIKSWDPKAMPLANLFQQDPRYYNLALLLLSFLEGKKMSPSWTMPNIGNYGELFNLPARTAIWQALDIPVIDKVKLCFLQKLSEQQPAAHNNFKYKDNLAILTFDYTSQVVKVSQNSKVVAQIGFRHAAQIMDALLCGQSQGTNKYIVDVDSLVKWESQETTDKTFKINVGRTQRAEDKSESFDFHNTQKTKTFDNQFVLLKNIGIQYLGDKPQNEFIDSISMYGAERSECQGILCAYKHFFLNAQYNLDALDGQKNQSYSGDHNHNDYISFGTSITYGQPPYIEFLVKTPNSDISHLALVRKDNGKWAFFPGDQEQGTAEFTNKMVNLQTYLNLVYSETRNPNVLTALQKLKAGDYSGLLASGINSSGTLLAENKTNGTPNNENQVRNLLAGSEQTSLPLSDSHVKAYITDVVNALYRTGTKSPSEAMAFFNRLQQVYLPKLAPEEIGQFGQTSFLILYRLKDYMDKGIIPKINPTPTLDNELTQLPQQMTFLPSTTSVSVKDKCITVISKIGHKQITYKLTLENNIVTRIDTTGTTDSGQQDTYVSQPIPLNSTLLKSADVEYLNRKVIQALVGSGDLVMQNLLELGTDNRLHIRSTEAYNKLNRTGEMISRDSKTFFMLKADTSDKLNPIITMIENAAGTEPLAMKFSMPMKSDGTPDNTRTGQSWLKTSSGWSILSNDIKGLTNASNGGGGVIVTGLLDDVFNFFKRLVEQWFIAMIGGWLLEALQQSIHGIEIAQQAMAVVQTANQIKQSVETFIAPYQQAADVANQAIALIKNPQSLLNGALPHEVTNLKQQVQQNIATIEQTVVPIAVAGQTLQTQLNNLKKQYETQAKVYIKIGNHLITETNGNIAKIQADIDSTGSQLVARLNIDMKKLKDKYASLYPDINWENQMISTEMVLPDVRGNYTDVSNVLLGKTFIFGSFYSEQPLPIISISEHTSAGDYVFGIENGGKTITIHKGTQTLKFINGFPYFTDGNKEYSPASILRNQDEMTAYTGKVEAFIADSIDKYLALGQPTYMNNVETHLNETDDGFSISSTPMLLNPSMAQLSRQSMFFSPDKGKIYIPSTDSSMTPANSTNYTAVNPSSVTPTSNTQIQDLNLLYLAKALLLKQMTKWHNFVHAFDATSNTEMNSNYTALHSQQTNGPVGNTTVEVHGIGLPPVKNSVDNSGVKLNQGYEEFGPGAFPNRNETVVPIRWNSPGMGDGMPDGAIGSLFKSITFKYSETKQLVNDALYDAIDKARKQKPGTIPEINVLGYSLGSLFTFRILKDIEQNGYIQLRDDKSKRYKLNKDFKIDRYMLLGGVVKGFYPDNQIIFDPTAVGSVKNWWYDYDEVGLIINDILPTLVNSIGVLPGIPEIFSPLLGIAAETLAARKVTGSINNGMVPLSGGIQNDYFPVPHGKMLFDPLLQNKIRTYYGY